MPVKEPARLIKWRKNVLATVAGEASDDKSAAESKPVKVEAESKESRFYRPIDRAYTWMLRWSRIGKIYNKTTTGLRRRLTRKGKALSDAISRKPEKHEIKEEYINEFSGD